jgi:transcriptional regulator with XRE-family HTH domain
LKCPGEELGTREGSQVGRNERLASAIRAARLDVDAVANATGVDPKTVYRWLTGRVPHPRTRRALAGLLSESEDFLWPTANAPAAAKNVTSEIVGAYAHRADLPATTWWELVVQARRQIDLLAYAMLFLPEQHTDLTSRLKEKAAASCRIRIALADPECDEVAQRDAHEQLGGALPARIRTTIAHLRELWDFPNIEIRFHRVPLYNATYRFDYDMLVTPYVYSAHGFQHPLLHLRRLGPDGIFANFNNQFERIWAATTRSPHLQQVLARPGVSR